MRSTFSNGHRTCRPYAGKKFHLCVFVVCFCTLCFIHFIQATSHSQADGKTISNCSDRGPSRVWKIALIFASSCAKDKHVEKCYASHMHCVFLRSCNANGKLANQNCSIFEKTNSNWCCHPEKR